MSDIGAADGVRRPTPRWKPGVQRDEFEAAVQLMTLPAPSADFPLVAWTGRGGMFPSQQSSEESGRLDEERALLRRHDPGHAEVV
jgi:hypothetical protein